MIQATNPNYLGMSSGVFKFEMRHLDNVSFLRKYLTININIKIFISSKNKRSPIIMTHLAAID